MSIHNLGRANTPPWPEKFSAKVGYIWFGDCSRMVAAMPQFNKGDVAER